MRRVVTQIFVVLILLGLMIGLDTLKAAPAQGTDSLTLAAIGFVVLAAFTVAELGSLLKLPKVTGFILAGLALGPYAGNILSLEVVGEMRMFNDLALGLIATSAGLELDGRAIVRQWKTLSVTVGVKLLLMPILVGGTFIVLQQSFGFLPLESTGAVIGLACVFSAFAVGTSPSISLAVLSETKSKGSLSDLTLSSAVLKDVVVVVCLAVAVAVTTTLTDPEGVLDAAVFIEVGKHLGEEVLLGVVVSIFLILYLRFVGAEMLLFVAAMILVVSQITEALHLQPLLVFIVAGFVIRNFTRYEHALLHPLEVVALPVFVVFFTNAGASVDLDATLAILPFALALCVARGIGFFIAARVGARVGGERPEVQQNAWMAYLPLAGVTLGLISLAAGQLEEFASVISGTGMAVVAVNLLVGPVTLRLALRRAGEIPDSADETQTDREPGTEPDTPVDELERPSLPDEELQAHLSTVEAHLDAAVEEFVSSHLRPWMGELSNAVRESLQGDDERLDAEALERIAALAKRQPTTVAPPDRALLLKNTFTDVRRQLSELPVEVRAPWTARHFHAQPNDTLWMRMRRSFAWMGDKLSGGRKRVIPLRMAARVAVEPLLAEGVRDLLGGWARTEAALYAELRQLVEGNRTPAEARSGIEGLLEGWLPRVQKDLERTVVLSLQGFAESLALADSLDLPVRALAYSRVEPQVTRGLQELERQAVRWKPALLASASALAVATRLQALQQRTGDLLREGFLEPLAALLESIQPEVAATSERLVSARRSLKDLEPLDEQALTELSNASRKAFPQEAHVRIKKTRAEFKSVVSVSRLNEELRALVQDIPETVLILGQGTPLQFAPGPDDVAMFEISLRRICEEALVVDLLPLVDERVREANALVTVVNSQLREHVSVATFAIDTALKSEQEHQDRTEVDHQQSIRALVADGLERARRRVDELAVTLDQVREETPSQVRERLAHAFSVIRAGVVRGRVETVQKGSRWERVRSWGARVVTEVVLLGRRVRHRASAWLGKLQASDLSQELQLRAGRKRMDAAALREWLYAESTNPFAEQLPPIYGRLFSLEPIHDRRLFAARRNALRTLIKEEQEAAEGRSDGVLVAGRHGSGRTSLLNVAQLEFRAPRVIRLGHEQVRAGNLLAALATELQCEPKPGEVRVALSNERTTIVIDDLEQWFIPDPKGLEQLERILDLVLTTRHVAFWVMTISEDALEIFDPSFAIRQAFGRVVMLEPLDAEALAHAVETRSRVSGLQIDYPRGRFASLLGDRQDEASRRTYYRSLARSTDGNLRSALRTWYHDIRPQGSDAVRPVMRVQVLGARRILDQLHPHALAILVQVLRFRVHDVEALRRTVALGRGEISRHLAFLRAAGILQRRSGLAGGLRIAPEVQPTILQAFDEAGALRRRP